LHGPYSAWDLNDRADKLAKDIQAARGKLKNAPPAATLGVMGGGAVASAPTNTKSKTEFLPTGNGVTPAAGMTASRPAGQAAPAADAKKQAALKLLADGQKLAEQGQYAAARAKFVEADKVGAAFAANEYNPGFAMNDLNARGHSAVETLLGESQKQ